MSIISFFKSVFCFNVHERDLWVSSVARSLSPGSKIIDVGAGGSPYRALLSHTIYKTQDFCQLRDDQLRGKSGYMKIDYVCDILNIPAPDGNFDAVLCTEVLEHVPYPILALKEMVRLVRPGGRLFITAPLGSGLHQIPYHYYGGYTPYWYKKFATEFGCKVKSIQSNGGYHRLHAQEALRFCILSLPWNCSENILVKFCLLVLLPVSSVLAFVAAFVGFYLKNREDNTNFTVGYHVVLEKI